MPAWWFPRAIYQQVRSGDLRLRDRVVIFTVFGINAALLWLLPGVFGLALGGGMGLIVALMVVGELWRQWQIRVWGVPAKVGEGE